MVLGHSEAQVAGRSEMTSWFLVTLTSTLFLPCFTTSSYLLWGVALSPMNDSLPSVHRNKLHCNFLEDQWIFGLLTVK